MMEPIVWLYRVVEADADPLRIPPRPYRARSTEDAPRVALSRDGGNVWDMIWPRWVG